jgi:hypothetical protein
MNFKIYAGFFKIKLEKPRTFVEGPREKLCYILRAVNQAPPPPPKKNENISGPSRTGLLNHHMWQPNKELTRLAFNIPGPLTFSLLHQVSVTVQPAG